MLKVIRKLKNPIIINDIMDSSPIDTIKLNRIIFDFDSDFVQIIFGVGEDKETGYVPYKRKDFFKKGIVDFFGATFDGFKEKMLSSIEDKIDEHRIREENSTK